MVPFCRAAPGQFCRASKLERLLLHRTTYVSVSDGCQHSVFGCSCGAVREPRPLERLEEHFLMAAWRGEHCVLGGADPVDHPQLLELLEFGRQRGVHHLALQTSARALTRTLRSRLATTGMVERLSVPLFAIHEAHHDGRVGLAGALRETRKGLLGWTREGGQATALGFIDRWNVSSLHRWPAWLREHGADSLLLVYGQAPSGWDRLPVEELPTLREVARELPRALRAAAELGLELQFTGIPECVLGFDSGAPPPFELGRPFDEVLDSRGQPVARAAQRRAAKQFASACPVRVCGPSMSSGTATQSSVRPPRPDAAWP